MSELRKKAPLNVELQKQAKNWNKFLGEEKISERQVKDTMEVLDSLSDKGWTNILAIVAPDRDFPQNASYPSWKIRPNKWFYDQVAAGRVSGEPTRIGSGIIIFDTTPKPNYIDGTQMYDDPESYQKLLADLRRSGDIETVDGTRQVLETSRYGISDDEYESVVFPALMEQIGVLGMVSEGRLKPMRLPTTIELNIYGNQFAPYIGDTTGWEWSHNRFDRDNRLVGGSSGVGGLSGVSYGRSGTHDNNIAGRFLGEIPSQTR